MSIESDAARIQERVAYVRSLGDSGFMTKDEMLVVINEIRGEYGLPPLTEIKLARLPTPLPLKEPIMAKPEGYRWWHIWN